MPLTIRHCQSNQRSLLLTFYVFLISFLLCFLYLLLLSGFLLLFFLFIHNHSLNPTSPPLMNETNPTLPSNIDIINVLKNSNLTPSQKVSVITEINNKSQPSKSTSFLFFPASVYSVSCSKILMLPTFSPPSSGCLLR